MESLLKDKKRDEALDRISIGIAEGAKNCVIVIKKICTICHKPEKYENISDLLDTNLNYLMTNKFYNQVEDWTFKAIISPENQIRLENNFFAYFFSLLPLHFQDEKVEEPWGSKKYKWTKNDFKELIINCSKKWFEIPRNKPYILKEDFNAIIFIENEFEKIKEKIFASQKAKKSIFNKEQKLSKILLPEYLFYEINNAKPQNFKEYQVILFDELVKKFINGLPRIFDKFVDDFYEIGGYLHKYFAWNNE